MFGCVILGTSPIGCNGMAYYDDVFAMFVDVCKVYTCTTSVQSAYEFDIVNNNEYDYEVSLS